MNQPTDNPSTPVVPVEPARPAPCMNLREAIKSMIDPVEQKLWERAEDVRDLCINAALDAMRKCDDDWAKQYSAVMQLTDNTELHSRIVAELRDAAALTPVPVVAAPPNSQEIWIRKIEHGEQPIRWGVYFGSETVWDFPENESHMAYALAENLSRILEWNMYDESSEFSKELMETGLAPTGVPETRRGLRDIPGVNSAGAATTPSPVSRESQFICRARKQGTAGGNDPADCDWPRCGCDPYANKVLDTIDESGFDIVPKSGVSREPISAEQHRIDISNLRFYMEQARKVGWHTEEHIIGPDVIKQTLWEISCRYEQLASAATRSCEAKEEK